MSEMVERVAKAIHNSEYNGDGNFHWREETADIYRRAARAALTAMREPTKAMVEAGLYDEDAFNLLGVGESALRSAFTRMIDAALAEKPVERE